jgi:hypothetical protein
METLDEVKNLWQQNTDKATGPALISKDIEEVIKIKVKKEKQGIAEYFWLSFTFQNFIYAFASYLLINYWGDTQIMIMTVTGVLLYIPLTIILMQKFKAMYKPVTATDYNIRNNITHQHKYLSQFFNFKKRFDLASVPLNAVILTGILFKLYVPGGIQVHPLLAVSACAVLLFVYSIATWFENKKHFIKPLKRLGYILEDIDKTS